MGNFVTDLRPRWHNISDGLTDNFEGSMINRPDDWTAMKKIIESGAWLSDEIMWGYGNFQEELANEFDPGSTRIMNPYSLSLSLSLFLSL